MVQKIKKGGNERGGEGKEEKEEEEEKEKEEDEEEDEEDEEEDKEDEEDEQDEEEEEDEAKRREEGGRGEGGGGGRWGGRGGGSLSKISSEETLSKLRLKLNQNKAKSTKHAGRPADLVQVSYITTYIASRCQLHQITNFCDAPRCHLHKQPHR